MKRLLLFLIPAAYLAAGVGNRAGLLPPLHLSAGANMCHLVLLGMTFAAGMALPSGK